MQWLAYLIAQQPGAEHHQDDGDGDQEPDVDGGAGIELIALGAGGIGILFVSVNKGLDLFLYGEEKFVAGAIKQLGGADKIVLLA